jgi:hypothetical protein
MERNIYYIDRSLNGFPCEKQLVQSPLSMPTSCSVKAAERSCFMEEEANR